MDLDLTQSVVTKLSTLLVNYKCSIFQGCRTHGELNCTVGLALWLVPGWKSITSCFDDPLVLLPIELPDFENISLVPPVTPYL